MTVSTSQPSPGKRVRSARGYAAYAADIGVSERTIKRWVARGRSAGDPFPLDDLATAVEWWARNGHNTPPAELVAAAAKAKRQAPAETAAHEYEVADSSRDEDPKGKGGAAPAASAPALPPASSPPASDTGRPLVAAADMVGGTIEQNLQRLHIIHSANLTLLEAAFGGSNEADVINRQRNAARSGEMLNAAQKAFDEYQRARGDVVPIVEVKRDLLRIQTAMAQSLLSIIEDLGVPRARAVGAVDSWYRMLRESRFFADTQPGLSARAPDAPAPA